MLLALSACQQTINYPKPVLTSLNPSSIEAGQPAFTLTVNGGGFTPATTVLWNGIPRVAFFQSITALPAQMRAAGGQNAGQATGTVTTPPPGGGEPKTPLAFTINPAPSPAP